MKIKMKVKTIILLSIGALVFIFGVVPFANFELADILREKNPVVAEKLYNNYLKHPTGLRKDEALYKKAQTIMGGFPRYFIMMGMKGGEERIDYDAINNAIESYKKIIVKYPKSKYYPMAYRDIMECYIYLGDSTNLERWIEWGKIEENMDLSHIATLYEGYNYFANREYHKADKALNDFVLENSDLDYIYYFLKGHIEFARENFDKALEFYNKVSETDWKPNTGLFGSRVPFRRKNWLEDLDLHKGENKIKGRVTSEGVGIPYVEIYIQMRNQGYRTGGMDFVAITDKDGYYETIGIKEGRYDIGIGIGTGILFEKSYLDKGKYSIEVPLDMENDFEFKEPIKIISPKPDEIIKEDKFVVHWEPVAGADYYRVESVLIDDGTVMTGPIRDENRETKIKGNKGVFDIRIIKNSPTGYSIDDNGIVGPEAITGYLYEGRKTPIIVKAYDKNDNMVGSSVPMASYYDNVPSIQTEGRLTEGEKLIVNKEYKEAIEHYEHLLLDDKDNIETLSYLSKLYGFGWGKGTADINKAMDYGKRVLDIYHDADVIFSILGHMSSDEFRENRDIINEILDLVPNEYRDGFFYSYRGEYYRSIGEFEKARKDYILGTYVNSADILYIDLYCGEYERAIDFLREDETSFYYMSKEKLIEGVEILSQMDKNHKEYIRFREYLYSLLMRDDSYEERIDKFKDTLNNIKNPGIRMILDEIKIDNHW